MNICKIHGIVHAADTCPACDIAAELAALRTALAGLLTLLPPAAPLSLVVQDEDKTGHVASGEHDTARANHILGHKSTREAVLVFLMEHPRFYIGDLKTALDIPITSRSPYIAPLLRTLGCHETGGGRWTVPASAVATLKTLCGRLPL